MSTFFEIPLLIKIRSPTRIVGRLSLRPFMIEKYHCRSVQANFSELIRLEPPRGGLAGICHRQRLLDNLQPLSYSWFDLVSPSIRQSPGSMPLLRRESPWSIESATLIERASRQNAFGAKWILRSSNSVQRSNIESCDNGPWKQ